MKSLLLSILLSFPFEQFIELFHEISLYICILDHGTILKLTCPLPVAPLLYEEDAELLSLPTELLSVSAGPLVLNSTEWICAVAFVISWLGNDRSHFLTELYHGWVMIGHTLSQCHGLGVSVHV